MKIDWKEIWDANPDVFVASGWEECLEEKRKGWHLPSQFGYFSSGDVNLRVGIIATDGEYKDEELLYGGIIWGNRLGNGLRTVIYFVAQDFSPVFLGAISKLGGDITAKAVYWREKLTPSLYPVQEKETYWNSCHADFGEVRPSWHFWRRQLNPVAWSHLQIIKNYFEGLAKRRVRVIFEKNKIEYRWGNIQIAEIKKKGNKFELSTKVKWTRNKIIASKFLKSGWVDFSGNINDEFSRAVIGILELLENMEVNGSLDIKDLLAIKLIHDRDFVPEFFGKCCEFPWLPKDRNNFPEIGNLYFFFQNNCIRIVYPVFDKPIQKIVNILLGYTALEYSALSERRTHDQSALDWDHKIFLLTQNEIMPELRLCQSWLKEPEKFPILLLPEDWKTEGLKSLKGLSISELEETYLENG